LSVGLGLHSVANPAGACPTIPGGHIRIADTWLACIRVIVLVMPPRLAAMAQSIYGTLRIGLAATLLSLASGVLYERHGGSAFLVRAALCLLALPMCAGHRSSQILVLGSSAILFAGPNRKW
jgi:hypothetical protein